MLFRIEHLRAFFAFTFLRPSVSLWVLPPRPHVSEQPAALQCAHSHPSALGRAVIATAEIPGAPWSSGGLTRDCLDLLVAFLVLRSRAETNPSGCHSRGMFLMHLCAFSLRSAGSAAPCPAAAVSSRRFHILNVWRMLQVLFVLKEDLIHFGHHHSHCHYHS